MKKIYINPNYTGTKEQANGGIRRVTDAMVKYLPDYGYTIVENPDEADIINNHGAMLTERPGVPMVSSNHGLYWQGYDWASWAHETNQHVINSMVRAQAITTPSNWVKNAVTRGLLRRPYTVYHGVDPDEFKPDPEPGNWVLWNKARQDPVSNPNDLMQLTRKTPNVRYVTTIGQEQENVKVIGEKLPDGSYKGLPYEQIKKYVAKAGVYLCTARETFGIGTLEALACGVPVVGWAYGGQAEIIRQDETGYLVPYGDYDKLAHAVQLAFQNRARLSANARQDVYDRWLWPDKIAQYAAIFDSVLNGWHMERPKVSVIVTSYNLERFLPNCLNSVEKQRGDVDWECIVVDDCSSDTTIKTVHRWVTKDDRFRYLRTPKNLGLSGARNYGFQHANGRYILYLDADDELQSHAVKVLADALDADPGIHIAYGNLEIMNEAGEERRRGGWPEKEFDYFKQIAHMNQLPYCAMMRREVLQESGGYRVRDWRAEDAAFWSKVTSFGFRAQKVTDAIIFSYRLRSDSKGQLERQQFGQDADGNWLAWIPWGLAKTGREGHNLKLDANSQIPTAEIIPWGAQGKPPKSWQRYRRFWNVFHHQDPMISIVIPVGPNHKQYLVDALDSLIAQDFINWECIVVNDTGDPWNTVDGFPWVRVVVKKKSDDPARGAGAARNIGAYIARGETLLFLDADDYLLPGALSSLWRVYQEKERRQRVVVYGDWLAITPHEKGKLAVEHQYYKSLDFACVRTAERSFLTEPIHPVTCLVPAWAHNVVEGFDEKMPVWEDWDYQIRLYAKAGVCGVRVEQAIMAYRIHTGQRRKVASVLEATDENAGIVYATNDKAKKYLYNVHREIYKGNKTMACSKCPGGKKSVADLTQEDRKLIEQFKENGGTGMILKFNKPGIGKVPVLGPITRQRYTVMNTPNGRLIYSVDPQDAVVLMARTYKGTPLYEEYKPPTAEPDKVTPTQTARTGFDDAPKMPALDANDIWANWQPEPIQERQPEPEKPVKPKRAKVNYDIVAVNAAEAIAYVAGVDEIGFLVQLMRQENRRDPKPRKTVLRAIQSRLDALSSEVPF